MKTKSFKKAVTTVAIVVAMLILASLMFVGCGNKNSAPSGPLNFEQYLTLTKVEIYPTAETTTADREATAPTLDGLKTAAIYKTLVFEIKEGFNMSKFSFNAKGEKTENVEKLTWDIAIQNTSSEATHRLADFYDFSKGETQSFEYKYSINDATLTTLLPAGSTITITIGVHTNETGFSAYTTPISLSDFAIA